MFQRAILAGAIVLAACSAGVGADEKDKGTKDSKKPADALKITVDVPKEEPTLAAVNAGRYAVTVKFENTGKEDLVLWPYLGAEVKEEKKNVVRPSMFLGRFGLRLDNKSVLEGTPFVTLKPGKTHEIHFALQGYAHH